MKLLGERLCKSVAPTSRLPCILDHSDPHNGGHVALVKPGTSAGWWYGDERDACERADREIQCETCRGSGDVEVQDTGCFPWPCPICHGSGKASLL